MQYAFKGSILLIFISALFAAVPAFAEDFNHPPVARPIHAVLTPPTTAYTIEADDPDGDPLTYNWDRDISCGIFMGSGGTSASWSHPEGAPPYGCAHEDGTSHDGTIYVHISDGKDAIICYYDGSESGDGPECTKDVPEKYYPGIFADFEDFLYEYCYYILIPALVLMGWLTWYFYNNGLFVGKKEDDDPCAELRKREAEARAKYEAAREAFNKADAAKQASDAAKNAADEARRAAERAVSAAGGRWSAHGSTDWEGEHIEVHKEGWQNKELGKVADDALAAAKAAADAAKKAKVDFDAAGGQGGWQSAKSAMDAAKAAWEAAAKALKVCISGIGVAPTPTPTPPPPPPPPAGPSGPTTTDGGSGGGTPPTTPPTTPQAPKKPEEPRRVCIDGEKRNEHSDHIDVSILDLSSVVLKQDRIYSDAGNEAMKFIDYLQSIKDVFMLGKRLKGGADAYLDKSITGAGDAVDLPDFLTFYDKGIDLLTKSMHDLYLIVQDKQRLGSYWLEYRTKQLTLTCTKWDQCENNRWVSHCELSVEDKGFQQHRSNPEEVFDVRELQRAINRLFTQLRGRYNGDKTRAEQFIRTCQ